jgi:uncharacterized membrane protein YbaN (DUF454 family)
MNAPTLSGTFEQVLVGAASEASAPTGPPVRLGYVAAGHVSLALGLVGAVLPLLPTTCFVLLAASCYAKGSDRFYQRLMAHRVFGPMIRDWQEYRAMSVRAKRWAIVCVIGSIGVSILVLDQTFVRLILAGVAVTLVGVLLRIPSRSGSVAEPA